MADMQISEINKQTNSVEYKCSAKSLSRLFKVTRSVQCCTSDRCLSQCECVCVCVCVCVYVCVSGWWWWWWGGGPSSVIRGVREGRGGKDGREFSFLTAWWMKLSFSLLVLAWRLLSLLPDGSRLKKLCVGWVGSPAMLRALRVRRGVVNVLERGERDTNDLLSCSHYPLKGLAAGRVAGAIPHSDAASQNALDGASVEGAHDGGRGSGSS